MDNAASLSEVNNGTSQTGRRHPYSFNEKAVELMDERATLLESDFINDPNGAAPKLSNFRAWLGLVRASIGPGAMALPFAFSSAGLPLAMILLCFFCVIIYFNMMTLIQLKRLHNTEGNVVTFGQVGAACSGKLGKLLVEASLVCMELGICTVYFSFCATNIAAAIFDEVNTSKDQVNITVIHDDSSSQDKLKLIMVALFPVLGGISMIREMKTLALLSGLANIVMAIGLLIIFYYLTDHLYVHGVLHEAMEFSPTNDGVHILLTVATIIYSFEGCGAMLPTQSAMQNPESFPRVCTYAFITYMIVYSAIGGLGIASFDFEEVVPIDDRGSISAVIAFFYTDKVDRTVVKSLNILLAIAVAMTYPLQFYAAIEVIEDKFGVGSNACHNMSGIKIRRTLIRAVVVAITLAIAIGIPKLNLVIAFFGALFGGSIELVLPPLLYILDKRSHTIGSTRRYWCNMLLLVVGVSATMGGSIQALITIFEPF